MVGELLLHNLVLILVPESVSLIIPQCFQLLSKIVLFFQPKALSRCIASKSGGLLYPPNPPSLSKLWKFNPLSLHLPFTPWKDNFKSIWLWLKRSGGTIPKSELILQICKIQPVLPLSVLWCDWAPGELTASQRPPLLVHQGLQVNWSGWRQESGGKQCKSNKDISGCEYALSCEKSE